MNKSEMAEKLAKKAELSKSRAEEIIDLIFSTTPGQGIIAVELDAGREVSVYGFGSFGTKYRGPRKGRNPATGAEIQIEGKTYPTFKAAKGLKDRVAE